MSVKKTILIVAALFFLSSCGSKKQTVKTEYVRISDTLSLQKKDSLINVLEHKYASQKEYTTVIENILSSTIKGTAGEKKPKLIAKEKQSITLNSGADSIQLQGVWDYIDYTWFKAPTSNVFKKERDSISNKLKSFEGRYNDLLLENKKLKETATTKDKKVTRYRIKWSFVFYAFAIGFILSLITFNFSAFGRLFNPIKNLFKRS